MRAHISWWATLAVGLVIQTTFLTHFLPDAWRPDFSRALVLWLALTGIPAGGVWYVFSAGLLVDAMSGAPLGMTAMLRLVIYAVARPIRGILELSPVLLLLGPIAVLAETVTLWALKALAFANPVGGSIMAGVAVRQSLIEAITVPVVFLILEIATGHHRERDIEA